MFSNRCRGKQLMVLLIVALWVLSMIGAIVTMDWITAKIVIVIANFLQINVVVIQDLGRVLATNILTGITFFATAAMCITLKCYRAFLPLIIGPVAGILAWVIVNGGFRDPAWFTILALFAIGTMAGIVVSFGMFLYLRSSVCTSGNVQSQVTKECWFQGNKH